MLRSWQRRLPLRRWLRILLFASLALAVSLVLGASPRALPLAVPALPPAQAAAPPSRLPETVLLFVVFLAGCVVVDRLLARRSGRDGRQGLEAQARRLRTLSIGVPEGMVHLEVLRDRHLLEQRLAPLGVALQWRSFVAASAMLEALSNGEIDFCGGGGTASLFSQAADHLFVRVARDKYTNPNQDAILVPNLSAIQSVAELRGRTIAVDQGSSAHFVLIEALRQAALGLDDVEIVYLPQPEALPRFRRGELDAWAIWMPYAVTETRKAYPGRPIASVRSVFGGDATERLPTLYYAVPELVRDYPAVLKLLLEEVNEAGALASREELDALERLTARVSIDPAALDHLRSLAAQRAVVPLDPEALQALQHQANILRDLQLIPRRINLFDGTYSLMTRQNWTY
jgi:sulfonate transport system substrate-binding protein